jgi:RHS repeat-associated protein
MVTAAADLGKLAAFVAAADGILNGGAGAPAGLNQRITDLRASYDSFQAQMAAGGSLGVANPDLMGSGPSGGELGLLATHYRNDRLFVEAVRRAFVDASGVTEGLVSADQQVFDNALTAALEAVAAQHHLDPAELTRRSPVTVDDPIAAGVPQSSGFVNDPICTATGHFLEVEEDFTWPERLAPLRWARTYSSRFVASGPLGRGWASWASTALLLRPDATVGYQGPDGQLAVFHPERTGPGYRRVSGLAAALAVVPGAGGDGHGGWALTWDWHSPHPGEVWRFDAAGRLATMSGPVIGTTRCEYDGGRLVALAHDGGRRLTVVWDDDRIARVESSCGRRARYHYDEAGDLVRSERVTGDRDYVVDARGLLVEVRDADGVRLCRNEYDAEGRVVAQVTPYGRETVLTYHRGRRTEVADTTGGPVALYEHDAAGRLVGLVDDLGHRLERTFDASGRCVEATGFGGATTRQGFDAGGHTAYRVGADGVEERWDYDGADRVTRHTVAGGATMTFEYDGDDAVLPRRIAGPLGWEMQLDVRDGLLRSLTDADGVTVRFDHDADGNVVAITNGLGAVTRFVPHVTGEVAEVTTADGAVLRLERDGAGRPLAARTLDGAGYRFEWTPAGRLAATVEPNGARTAYEAGSHGDTERIVDALGATIELQRDHMARLVGLAAPGGAKWGFDYTATGMLSLVTDPTGAVWQYGYDGEGRMVSATDPLGHEVQKRHNPAGRLVELIDRLGNATRYGHDALGRVVREEAADGGVTTTEWDELGRPTAVRFPDGDELAYEYTPAGRVRSVRTAEGRGWTNTYDAAGRLVAVADAGGATTRFAWDACDRMTAVTAPSGRVDRLRYDVMGRVVESERAGRVWRTEYDHAGRVVAATDPAGATVRYGYDLRGKLVSATDALGATVRIRYDERGNPAAFVDALGGLVTTAFDAMRRPVATTDQLGRTTRIERDLAGRVVRQELPTGDVVTWRRDARGQSLDVQVNGRDAVVFDRDRVGRPVLIHEPAGNRTLTLAWTPGGRLRSLDADGRALRWERDRDGRVVVRHEPSGRVTRYHRGPSGRLAAVEVDGAGRVELDHDPDGRPAALRGAGVDRRWDHDAGGLVVATHLGDGTTVELTRDAAGRVVEMRSGGTVSRYRYDAAGQLVAASRGSDAWAWHYDPAGRLVREEGPAGTRVLTYDEAHQLVRIDGPAGPTAFSYDEAGRRTAEHGPAGSRHYGWDPRGRLSSIEVDGRRHVLDVDAVGRLAAVDGVRLDWDPTASVTELVALGDDPVLSVGGMVLGLAGGGPLPGDGAGSTDRGDGRDPWGHSPSRPGAAGPALGWLGEVEIDGLTWLRNRVYDPATRQFLSPDPLPGVPGLPGVAHPYQYANGDPIGFVDPLGLQGQPLTVGQYNDIRAQETGPQWNNIVTAGLVVVGVAAMFIPGVNLAGAVLIGAALGAAGGAAPGVIQGFQTGNWDWSAIGGGALKGAVVGAAAGPFGRGAGALTSRAGVSLTGRFGTSLVTQGTRASTAFYGGVAGAGSGAATGTFGELYDLTPLPGSDGQFDPEAVAVNTVIGGGTGAGGAAALWRPHPAQLAATDQINLSQGMSPRPGAGGALVTADGTPFPASSAKGGQPPALNPQVQQVMDDMQIRGPGHGRCVEPQSVSNALDAGVDPRGGVMSTGQVRADGNPKHGQALPPCPSCSQLLDHFGIDWLPPA